LTQKGYLKKVLQKFNINDDTVFKYTVAPYFKLKATISPTIVEERMSHVPYASTIGRRGLICYNVSMVSRYMHDPDRGHWEAVKRILRYIKGTIDVSLMFER